MRLAAYAGASTALAGAVLIRAFTERPNFYSAAVYLGQSNACNLILMNFLLLSFGSTVFGLQRLLYGQLRPIEIEQLWDKGWYAVTETALAMTTFRDEVGGWFFILFMSLLAGKVWAWIGEGRVEILEQQPPANPRLFHTRLIASLLVSEIFDLLMLRYCIHTLQELPRPGMMVMFAFEFAVLLVASTSTLARYSISAYEIYVEKQQRRIRLEERRAETQAAQGHAEPVGEGVTGDTANAVPAEPELNEEDVDVPGWQDKGRYVLFLDLATDFLKLILYAAFFAILIIFTGIPIHMFRDLFITLRSFLKRINDFLKYRNATKDMNSRYPDATAQDLERDNTCIICREDMHVWQQPEANAHRSRNPPDERQRAKKLPCGHILHVGCLRSWLERQQVCPVCRASVLSPAAERETGRHDGAAPRDGLAGGGAGAAGAGAGAAQADNAGAAEARHDAANRDNAPNGADGAPDAPPPRLGNFRARTFGIGNFRMTFGIGNLGGGNAAQAPAAPAAPHATPTAVLLEQALERYRRAMEERSASGSERTRSRTRTAGDAIQTQLSHIERRITDEINSLHNVQHQLAAVRALQGQLEQLRSVHEHPPPAATAASVAAQSAGPSRSATPAPPSAGSNTASLQPPLFQLPEIGSRAATANLIPAGHPDLPEGLSLPEGWSVLPMGGSRRRGSPAPPSSHLGAEDVVDQAPVPSTSSHEHAERTQSILSDSGAGVTNVPTEQASTSISQQSLRPSESDTKAIHSNGEQQHDSHEMAPESRAEAEQEPAVLPQWDFSAQPSILTGSASHETQATETTASTQGKNETRAAETTASTESRDETRRALDNGINGAADSSEVAEGGKGKAKVATVEDADHDGHDKEE